MLYRFFFFFIHKSQDFVLNIASSACRDGRHLTVNQNLSPNRIKIKSKIWTLFPCSKKNGLFPCRKRASFYLCSSEDVIAIINNFKRVHICNRYSATSLTKSTIYCGLLFDFYYDKEYNLTNLFQKPIKVQRSESKWACRNTLKPFMTKSN